jgi:heparanase 1
MNMTGALLAEDFATLRALLREPRFAGLQQTIYGPDACCEDRVTPPRTFVRDFAAASAAAGTVDGVTIHIYPLPRFANNSCDPPLFTSKDTLASLVVSTLQYASWAAPLLRAGAPLIVGETATSAHGGCDGLSNRFIAGFTLFYELGTYAELGVAQMNRQDLAGFSSETEPSNYGLLGPPGWFSGPLGQPHPDYFSLLLFKQLVGQRVLSSAFSAAANLSTVWDSHVFCAASGGGAVALTFFNMAGDALVLTVPQLAAAQAPREEFILTSSATPEAPLSGGVSDWPASLTADAIFLNGVLMATNADGTLPQWPVPGRVVTDPGEAIAVPPWSYGLIVFRDAGADACR